MAAKKKKTFEELIAEKQEQLDKERNIAPVQEVNKSILSPYTNMYEARKTMPTITNWEKNLLNKDITVAPVNPLKYIGGVASAVGYGATEGMGQIGTAIKESAPYNLSRKIANASDMSEYEQQNNIKDDKDRQAIIDKYVKQYGSTEKAVEELVSLYIKKKQTLEDIGGLGKFQDPKGYAEKEQELKEIEYARDLIQKSRGGTIIPNDLGDVAKSILDVIGIGQFAQDFSQELSTPFKQVRDVGENTIGDSAKEFTEEHPFVGGLAQSTGRMGISAATTALTGSTAAGMAVFGASAKGGYYEDFISKGYSKRDAEKASNVMTAVEIGSEFLGDMAGGINIFKKGALKELAQKPLSQALKAYLIEGGEEVFAEIANIGLETNLGEDITLEEARDRIIESFLSGVALSIAMQGVGKIGVKAQEVARKITNGENITTEDMVEVLKEKAKSENKSVDEVLKEYIDEKGEIAPTTEKNEVLGEEIKAQSKGNNENIPTGTQTVQNTTTELNTANTQKTGENLTENEKKSQNNEKNKSNNDLKQKQLEIIQKNNPIADDYHVGIRKIEDIKSFDEVINDGESFVYGDFTKQDAEKALEDGKVTVYSSKPIEQGSFVSTSENMAKDYAGNGKVYSQEVDLNDVAWINGDEGQYAKVGNENKTNKLEDRVSGDDLLNAKDLIEELKNAGAQIDDNGYVTLYHQTTKENADNIIKSGKMSAKEDGIFFSTSKEASQSENRGEVKLEFKIPVEKLQLDDIFEDNADVKIPLLNKDSEIDILEYLKNNDVEINNNNTTNPNFSKEYDSWDKTSRAGSFVLGKTSNALKSIGLNDYTIVIDKSKIISILNKHPEMNDKIIKQIPNILENPTLILKSQTVDGRIIVFSEVKSINNKPILVAMELEPAENRNNIEKIYKVASAYERKNVKKMQDWLDNKDNILYIDKQKNRTINWLNGLGLQLPVPYNSNSSIDSIASSKDKVNTITNYSMQENGKNVLDINKNGEKTGIDKKSLNELVKNTRKALGLTLRQTEDLKATISAYTKGDIQTKTELWEKLNEQFGEQEVKTRDEYIKQVKDTIKDVTIKVNDQIKADISDYYKFRQSNFGKLKLNSKEGIAVDTFYKELSESYPDLFPADIAAESDELKQIAEVANMSSYNIETYRMELDKLVEAAEFIHDSLQDYRFTADKKLVENDNNGYYKLKTREQVREELLEAMDLSGDELAAGDDIKSINYQLTDPVRVNEKVFGRKLGKKINEATINKTKHNTAEKIRWQNKEREEIASLGIKARSKESAAVQKYGEKKYIDNSGNEQKYGDIELSKEFPNVETQEKIKNAAKVLREKYDIYLENVNNVLTQLGYNPIPKRIDYMRHFQELTDKFSQAGVPLNPNDMKAEDLPTDINGLTEFNKPGKNWFASAQHRYGEKTNYDAITGIDGYIEGVGNLLYHTEDIQRYRALTNLIRETFGQTLGYENLKGLNEKQISQRIEDIQNNKLSGYVAWLDEQANSLAGKKGALDRGTERLLGRNAYTLMNTLKSQVGSNMTGFNVRSAMTNLISSTIASAKTNKIALAKGIVSTINNMFRNDDFINKSDFLTARFGSDSLSKKVWQKISNAGQIFMTGTDYFTANVINRSKYYEGLQKGMSEAESHQYADDFSSRVMGDRSQGSTAEVFNSKTLGLLSQFQLEVNNQWQYMVHDTKMDFQEKSETSNGLKAGASVLWQMGQLAAYSYLFNEIFEKLTGSRAAFDILEIIKKIFGLDDDDKDKDIDTRMSEAGRLLVDGLPFANLITGGGRIPISEALTGIGTLISKVAGEKDKYGNDITWNDVGSDMLGSLPYYILPTGLSQAKKTIQGLGMYDEDLPIPGSYTDSGNLRYTVEDDFPTKLQAGLFGKWANENAKKYIESGYKTINKNKIQELVDLGYDSNEYRNYRQGITDINNKELLDDESRAQLLYDYIESQSATKRQKDIMIKNTKTDKQNEKQEASGKSAMEYWGELLEQEATKRNVKNSVAKSLGGNDSYEKYLDEISKITADKDKNGKTIKNSKKQKILKYINGLDADYGQKIILYVSKFPSEKATYLDDIVDYLDSRKDITYEEEESILKDLGYTVKNGNVSY